MKKTILAISIAVIATLSSCGSAESTANKGEVSTTSEQENEVDQIYEETLKAQDEINEINDEIDELDAVGKELEDLGNELDNI